MEIVKDFIVTFIESNAFMLFWCKFSLKTEDILFKNIPIAFISSLVMAVTYSIHKNFSMILTYIIMVSLISFFYKERFARTFLGFSIVLILIMILQLILMYFLGFLISDKYVDSFTYNASIQLVILLSSVAIYYFVPNKKMLDIIELNSKIAVYMIINFIGYILVFKVVWEYNKNLILNNIILFIGMIIMIFILNLFLCYNIVKINEEKKLIEVHNKYNPIIENIIEEARRKQHDFKNHINTINGIVQVAKEEELKASLTTYIKSLNYFTKNIEDIIYIDNLIIRAVIYSKLCEAEKKNISFSYSVSNDALDWKVKEYELSDMITNLLNNAFEATENSIEKSVTINIFEEGDKNIIEVKNSVSSINSEDFKDMFNRGFSTKKGKNRGYGLYNIKKIVESNGGIIQLSFDNCYICFRISL
ncbi:GHKL domain-containing protein [Clostridium sp. A1-XYC3]|uniref:GHKL domain-containing protein n=1 Tax=Clostridium tanneri TaxID=3037988 RepID=A0ABU4JRD5_9CLOT|nr:GHKL domain-containing protein [Clostridium sp. A1-XYC3]MDW8800705.1 GHKL domain-containing protein [Clostridium sp. A1-XYC3]